MIVEVPNCRWWVEIDENQYPFCACNIYIDDFLIEEAAFDFDTGKFDCIDDESKIKAHENYERNLKLLEKEIKRAWESEY